MNVIHLVFKEFGRKDIAPIVIVLPNFIFLPRIDVYVSQDRQGFLVLSHLQFADDLPHRVTFEIPHHFNECVIFLVAGGKVNVIGHDDKNLQVHSPAGAEEMKTIYNHAFDGVLLEEMKMIDGIGCHEGEKIGIES